MHELAPVILKEKKSVPSTLYVLADLARGFNTGETRMDYRAGAHRPKAWRHNALAQQRALKAVIGSFIGTSNRSLLLRFRRDQSGSYLIMSGLLMPVLIGIAALGSEVGLWLYKHQRMQGAADVGAVSAAIAYGKNHGSNLALEAGAVTASYDF